MYSNSRIFKASTSNYFITYFINIIDFLFLIPRALFLLYSLACEKMRVVLSSRGYIGKAFYYSRTVRTILCAQEKHFDLISLFDGFVYGFMKFSSLFGILKLFLLAHF